LHPKRNATPSIVKALYGLSSVGSPCRRENNWSSGFEVDYFTLAGDRLGADTETTVTGSLSSEGARKKKPTGTPVPGLIF